ncbi:MAG: histidinol dehydrogenase [Clostridiales bacterium]|nr:histidinol dehydrogenase [Clostridiales bacterium]
MQTLKSSKTRTAADRDRLRETVRDMIETVVSRGDDALREYNSRFDGCERTSLQISREEIDAAYSQVSEEEINNMKIAASNIREFAKAQRRTVSELEDFSPMPGIMLGHRVIPVDSCCCYVPGGGYPLYSTALMLGIPAKVAGVRRVAACSPVMKGTDHIHPKTLVAMDIAGIDEIYATGGAQAVAAFSYGTDQIKPVDLIVGPGNSFVTEAKRQCYGKVGIDFLAGPSEVLVIADGSADPEIIAADLLAQSEHDREAKGILVTTDRELGLDVIKCVEKELETLATAEIASVSWADYGEVLLADSLDEAVSYANGYAPEHLEVNVAKADRDRVVGALRNYGSLFIGENTAEVFGDYASGTNHTLPTLGAARYTGGVWVGTFLKTCTYQHMTDEAMMDIAPVVTALADGEGLAGHAEAADIRRRKQEK